jgi:hypothetical protein
MRFVKPMPLNSLHKILLAYMALCQMANTL